MLFSFPIAVAEQANMSFSVSATLGPCLLLVSTLQAAQLQPPPASATSVAAELHEAIAAAQSGNARLAQQTTEAILAKHPGYEPALKFEGALREAAGDAAGAQAYFEQALQLDPNDPELLFSVGVARLSTGRYAEAATLLRKGAKLSPQDPQLFFYLAQAEHLTGNDDGAVAASRRSVQLDPEDAALLQKYGELLSSSGNNAEAYAMLAKAERLDPTLDRLQYDLALVSLRNEKLDAAAAYAAAADKRHPGELKTLRLRAEIAVKLGQWQQAQELFMAILTVDPADTASRVELGHSQLALKQFGAARQTLEAVLRSDPTSVLAHFYLARAYAGLGMKTEAAHENELHRQMVANGEASLPPGERAAEQAAMEQARALLSSGDEAAALALFRQRMQGPLASPGEPYVLVGVTYLSMGRRTEAERLLQRALAVQPDAHDAHAYLGLLALQHGDAVEAERQLHAELLAHPDSTLASAELGELRYHQQRWAEAAEQIAKSRTLSPPLLYMLSDAYFHLGQDRQAVVTAELAADYGRNDPANLAKLSALLKQHGQAPLAATLTTRY